MSEEEKGLSGKPFLLSDYREGFYQANGVFSPEPLLSSKAIDAWEDENQRLWQGKAWGAGQALFFRDKPLVFGRNTDAVDVKVDADPDPDEQSGYAKLEIGVSRRHFELQPPKDDKVTITDLGSRNGVDVFHGRNKTELKGNGQSMDLEVGDFTFFGGGPGEHGRLIGFRVCKDAAGKIYLVKFNATSLEDIFTIGGIYKPDEEPRQETQSTEREIDVQKAVELLAGDMRGLQEAVKKGRTDPSVTLAYTAIFMDLFTQALDIGAKHFSNDASTAAACIGKQAIDKAEEVKDTDKFNSARYTEVALLAMKLASGKLTEEVKEE